MSSSRTDGFRKGYEGGDAEGLLCDGCWANVLVQPPHELAKDEHGAFDTKHHLVACLALKRILLRIGAPVAVTQFCAAIKSVRREPDCPGYSRRKP